MRLIQLLLILFYVSACSPNIEIERVLLFKADKASLSQDGENLAQELGFAKDARLLVVNSDDIGAHRAFTDGTVQLMAHGIVKSTSIIVTDRNDAELDRISALAK